MKPTTYNLQPTTNKKFIKFCSVVVAPLLLVVGCLLLVTTASAAPTCPPNSPGVCLTIDVVLKQLEFLACWFGSMAILLVVIMLFVYGLMFVLSSGDSTKFSEAKKALNWGIIGAFVIIGAYVIIVSVAAFVGDPNYSLPFNC